jgi:hypothetical protein
MAVSGAASAAWVQDGGRGQRAPLALTGGASVTVEIEAGGLRLVGFVLR